MTSGQSLSFASSVSTAVSMPTVVGELRAALDYASTYSANSSRLTEASQRLYLDKALRFYLAFILDTHNVLNAKLANNEFDPRGNSVDSTVLMNVVKLLTDNVDAPPGVDPVQVMAQVRSVFVSLRSGLKLKSAVGGRHGKLSLNTVNDVLLPVAAWAGDVTSRLYSCQNAFTKLTTLALSRFTGAQLSLFGNVSQLPNAVSLTYAGVGNLIAVGPSVSGVAVDTAAYQALAKSVGTLSGGTVSLGAHPLVRVIDDLIKVVTVDYTLAVRNASTAAVDGFNKAQTRETYVNDAAQHVATNVGHAINASPQVTYVNIAVSADNVAARELTPLSTLLDSVAKQAVVVNAIQFNREKYVYVSEREVAAVHQLARAFHDYRVEARTSIGRLTAANQVYAELVRKRGEDVQKWIQAVGTTLRAFDDDLDRVVDVNTRIDVVYRRIVELGKRVKPDAVDLTQVEIALRTAIDERAGFKSDNEQLRKQQTRDAAELTRLANEKTSEVNRYRSEKETELKTLRDAHKLEVGLLNQAVTRAQTSADDSIGAGVRDGLYDAEMRFRNAELAQQNAEHALRLATDEHKSAKTIADAAIANLKTTVTELTERLTRCDAKVASLEMTAEDEDDSYDSDDYDVLDDGDGDAFAAIAATGRGSTTVRDRTGAGTSRSRSRSRSRSPRGKGATTKPRDGPSRETPRGRSSKTVKRALRDLNERMRAADFNTAKDVSGKVKLLTLENDKLQKLLQNSLGHWAKAERELELSGDRYYHLNAVHEAATAERDSLKRSDEVHETNARTANMVIARLRNEKEIDERAVAELRSAVDDYKGQITTLTDFVTECQSALETSRSETSGVRDELRTCLLRAETLENQASFQDAAIEVLVPRVANNANADKVESLERQIAALEDTVRILTDTSAASALLSTIGPTPSDEAAGVERTDRLIAQNASLVAKVSALTAVIETTKARAADDLAAALAEFEREKKEYIESDAVFNEVERETLLEEAAARHRQELQTKTDALVKLNSEVNSLALALAAAKASAALEVEDARQRMSLDASAGRGLFGPMAAVDREYDDDNVLEVELLKSELNASAETVRRLTLANAKLEVALAQDVQTATLAIIDGAVSVVERKLERSKTVAVDQLQKEIRKAMEKTSRQVTNATALVDELVRKINSRKINAANVTADDVKMFYSEMAHAEAGARNRTRKRLNDDDDDDRDDRDDDDDGPLAVRTRSTSATGGSSWTKKQK